MDEVHNPGVVTLMYLRINIMWNQSILSFLNYMLNRMLVYDDFYSICISISLSLRRIVAE
jgi:hypothetical protein